MSIHAQPSSTVRQLRALAETGRLVRDEQDLQRLFDQVAAAIADSLGFATVSINVHRPAWDDFQVVTVHGNETARATLLGNRTPPTSWEPYLDSRFLHRGAYLVPYDEIDWIDPDPVYVPDLEPGDQPDAWHPDDVLIVPLARSDGHVLGFVSVDEPESGRRPADDELDLLTALAGHVAAAIESAQAAIDARRHRESLAQLLEISSQLTAAESVDDVLAAVARGIQEALEFEKVAVCLLSGGRGFVPRGLAGWDPGDPALDFAVTVEDLDRLRVPEFEVAGCYLVDHETANRLVASGSSYTSHRNGAGPQAWSRHWLLVPLVERDGSMRGFIWADDPADCLIPAPERLRALRTFANQATIAMRAAADVERLNARNRELDALHGTTLSLLEHLDVESVLTRIVDSARSLVGAEHAYLYVVDPASDRLRLAVGLGCFAGIDARPLERGVGVGGRTWELGAPFVVDDYSTWSGGVEASRSLRLHATAGVPLVAGGVVRGVLGLVFDEPERRFAESELSLLERFARMASIALENARLYAAVRQSEELHRQVVESSTDLIALLDLQGAIVLASRAYEAVLGYAPAELVGTQLAALVEPDDLAAVRERLVDGAVSDPVTARLRHRDGHWILVEGVATPIRGETGETELQLVIARDVTERERLQEQLRQAQKMESVGRLAGGIAHDFNNLLTAIRGYAQLSLADLEETAPVHENLVQIERASARAADLTGQLLAYSRKQVLRPRVLDLNAVVSGMSPMLSRMLREDVVLSTVLDPDLWPTRADPSQLEQVVLNLVVNARDAMPEGGRLVLRTANLEHEDGHHVALVVADTGTGMDPHVAAQIFEPFFTTKPVGEGTGLGLSTVHGIVAQSGGTVTVESEPGTGTVFTVCLPRAAA